MSTGYKRLPHQDVPDKPIKTTLVKKKLTDGETESAESFYVQVEEVFFSDM